MKWKWLATGVVSGAVGGALLTLGFVAEPSSERPDCDTLMMETARWRVEAANAFEDAQEIESEVESLSDIAWQVAGNSSGYGKALNRAAVWAEAMSGCTPLGRDLTQAEILDAESLLMHGLERRSDPGPSQE